MKYEVVQMSKRHAKDVAELHAMALPEGFLSTLGLRFLGDLYQLIQSSPCANVWVAELEDGRCIGFLSGTANVKACYSHVIRRGWARLAISALMQVRRLEVLRRIWETVMYPNHSSSSGSPDRSDAIVPGELLSIAVSAEARGLGVGRKLVGALDVEMNRWEYRHSHYRVVTDAADAKSNTFYQSLGFIYAHDFMHHGNKMSCYLKAAGQSP